MALLKAKGKKILVALDDGHGMSTPGKRTPIFPKDSGLKSETGDFMHENEFNRAVVKYLKDELIYNGISVLEVAPTDADTSLTQRCKTANAAKADLYVSIHANALNAKWGKQNGLEVLSSPKNKDIANVFLKYLLKGTPQTNRGWKDGAWLGIVKGTDMPAILLEAGFMDNLTEAKLLLQDSYRRECAIESAQAICEVFGVTYKKKEVPSLPKKEEESVYKYDTSKGIGTLRVLVDSLNVRKGSGVSHAVISAVEKHDVYYVYETKNSFHRISQTGWVSANAKYTAFTAHPKVAARKEHVVVKGDTLYGIATKHKLSVDEIIAFNPNVTAQLTIGQKIYLS